MNCCCLCEKNCSQATSLHFSTMYSTYCQSYRYVYRGYYRTVIIHRVNIFADGDLQFFIGKVYQQLLKVVILKRLEPENVQYPNSALHARSIVRRCADIDTLN